MIIAKPLGGLGNQMFAYAAAYSLARRQNIELRIDKSNFDGYKTWPYLLDRLHVPQDLVNPVKPILPAPGRLRRLFRQARPGVVCYTEPHFHFDAAFEGLLPPVELNGYFQSWKYFAGFELELRERFRPLEALSLAAADSEARIIAESCPVSLHVRRGDYLNPGTTEVHGCLDLEYYRRAIGLMRGLHPQARFFLFSDDPEWVAANLLPGMNACLVRGNDNRPWEDMQLMARCKHHIIANSSFGWWGAWLDQYRGKTVIAPRQWFSPELLRLNNICDMHPPDWILL